MLKGNEKMRTKHIILYEDARNLASIGSESVNLVVTSPPYPMIAMWDEAFSSMNPEIRKCLDIEDGDSAYRLMHAELDRAWREVWRVLRPGGLACINIGDATRTIGKVFKMYPSHVNVQSCFVELGFHLLPQIVWRKPTNSPTKFMGSGMLPCNAYVTLEHERILIFRKPTSRSFSNDEETLNRRRSSYFWEERNIWFSDLWDLTGAKQEINSKPIRKRSGAFPLELPLRLIRMYSSREDTVLDPFLGTATNTLASIICSRNSVGVEVDTTYKNLHREEISSVTFIQAANSLIRERIRKHLGKMDELTEGGNTPKYQSKEYGFPVVTSQETDILFEEIETITRSPEKDEYSVEYRPLQLSNATAVPELRSPVIGMRVPRGIYRK